MFNRLLYTFAVICGIALLAGGIIAYGRGYRFNPAMKSVTSTGILSALSSPDGASIFINDKLVSATNTSLNIAPGWYDVRISKEGYQPWEKRVKIQGEVVSRVDALLIPANPSLRAITFTGISSPSLSPSGTRVAYIVTKDDASSSGTLRSKTGVWILDLRSGTLGGIPVPKQIYLPSSSQNLSSGKLIWSPDEKQLILTISRNAGTKETIASATQLSTDGDNNIPPDVTASLSFITDDFQLIKKQKDDETIKSLPLPLTNLFSTSAANIKFSPDDTKILYTATASALLAPVITPPVPGSNSTEEVRNSEKGKYYIYDTKEDKNFYLGDQQSIADPSFLSWYSDSKHIIMIEKDMINIIDYDGTNKRTVYGGPFENNMVFPWASGGQLVILTNLHNPQSLPNLYEIDLR